MSDCQQFFMSESCFLPEVRFGCVCIENADRLPLGMVNVVRQPGQATLALDGATGEPGELDSFVAINTFQFPAGLSEFEQAVEWFGRKRKSRARLPDGIMFDKNVLAVRDAPEDWEHVAYPQSDRTFVHIYRGARQALLIRWIARTGTILDHALFAPLLDGLRIVPDQWITDTPSIHSKSRQQEQIRATPLMEDVQLEIEQSSARARDALQLGRVRKPAKIAEAIHDAIDALRKRKAKKKEKEQFAIDCGSLWGQALCTATGWAWQHLEVDSGEGTYAVCSPNGSHAVIPLRVVFHLVTHPKTENNSLLLFNLIASGNVPASTAGAYSLLQ
ncbi:MAG: hypothetical protein U0935_12155 [Pirellulales bacterium]